MKKKLLHVFSLFSASIAFAQTAKLQVIHNCASPVADTVDVYAGSVRLLDDFAFRTATSYVDVPAGVPVRLGIALKGSSSVADTIAGLGQTVSFESGKSYVAIAGGIVGNGQANPNGVNTAFKIFASEGLATLAPATPPTTSIKIFHGSTDAPAVDVVARGVGPLASNLKFADFTDYLSVPSSKYLLDIKPAGTQTIVATYEADLSLAPNTPLVVFASGFFTPTDDGNGPGFGIFAATPAGDVIALPLLTTARLQVIHNAADPVADTVDVYAGSVKLIDDFAFRSATPFIDVAANTDIRIGLGLKNSTSVNDTVPGLGTTINLPAGGTYVAIANGVTPLNTFEQNPDGKSITFSLYSYPNGKETSGNANEVSLLIFHGATDAPAVDAIANGTVPLASDISYGDFSGSNYTNVPAAQYYVSIHPAGSETPLVKYDVNLTSLGGGAAVVLASGFLTSAGDPEAGKPFALIAALPNGNVVTFPTVNITTGLANPTTGIQRNWVYPNPAKDQFQIALDGLVKVELVNQSGTVDKSIANGANVIDVTGMKPGMYVLKAYTQKEVHITKLNINN